MKKISTKVALAVVCWAVVAAQAVAQMVGGVNSVSYTHLTLPTKSCPKPIKRQRSHGLWATMTTHLPTIPFTLAKW